VQRRGFLLSPFALAWARWAQAAPDPAEEDLLRRLRAGGFVLLMRHAETTEGYGDPPGMKVGDCSTQRNLSEAGRAHARGIGERLKSARVPIAQVYTSPWCRCRETAVLAFGHAEDWEPLSSTFEAPDRDAAFTEHVKKRIASYARRSLRGNVVMVTHNTNIASIAKLSVKMGEIVVVRPDGCCGVRPVERLAL
jgi:broad specificity phosphatase PhoE